jgi:hypothetical protein
MHGQQNIKTVRIFFQISITYIYIFVPFKYLTNLNLIRMPETIY